MNPSTKFFPKQFPQKLFPKLSQKIFPAHAMNARFAIFRKCRIASFARIPASTPRFMQPTLKTGMKKTALPSRPAEPRPSALPAPSQTSRDRPLCQCTFSRAAATERGGGEPPVRAVDAGGAGEGNCWEVMTAKICGKYPMAPSKWGKTILYYLIHHHIGSIKGHHSCHRIS